MATRLLLALGIAGLIAAVSRPGAAQTNTVRVAVQVDNEAPGYEGYRALDGDPATLWHTDWQTGETKHPHQILLDLGTRYALSGISVRPREGGGNGTIGQFECYVSDDRNALGPPVVVGTLAQPNAENRIAFPAPVQGRFVVLRALSEVAGRPWTSIAELQPLAAGVIFRAKDAGPLLLVRPDGTPMDEIEVQFAVLQHDLRQRAHCARVAPETFHPASLVTEADRDPVDIVVRRAAALLADLQAMPGAPDLSGPAQQLAALAQEASAVDPDDVDARLALFRRVCAVRRTIALANPLLDFDRILFIKRHRARFDHMCDQYYGINAEPGGGLFVLEHPFSAAPEARDLLADSTVETGRLAGQKLQGGSFLSPDLSYDARRIAFAYVECRGDTEHRYHTDSSRGHWHEGRCYHVFTVNADGTALAQRTDGTWNDFDPCWLPGGRLALISERRGGYLRCGRVCPNYNLYDMAADGTGLRCLSYHETNEWNPSVTHDGRIVFTRWDYVDRHGCTAHMPWTTTLDGRDSRAVHGNFSPRPVRPDMELDVRAVPGSGKLVATAAPHHGQAFGSLVLVDPRVPDDDAMGPVKRLTPEVGFPETQGGAQSYGTAWPLGEMYYLCAYDPAMRPGDGAQGGYRRGEYGIYLVDAFGNRELIYRDPEIACQSPIPLRPRVEPPAMPSMVAGKEQPYVAPSSPGQASAPGTVAVIDVYTSRTAWPEGTRIRALRVVQVLPMTVPSGSPPHEVGMRIATAGDSVTLCRNVLGTVPVEADGSAHFVVPSQKEFFLQALDENGLAIQSMRSATYVQPGERLVCHGCHEQRHGAPTPREPVPLALLRPASVLQPDVEGSNPFSYARLVQPVLDRHCVECHAGNAATAPNLAREPITRNWYASYANLAPNYGFYDYGSSVRTTPGQFGARASKLYDCLRKGHYDVSLTPEEMHRLTLWLDLCSVFYGVYEKEGGQAQLRGEVAYPTLE